MRKILVTAIVVPLAILAWMNAGYLTSLNFFGAVSEGVSVLLIAAVSFAVGVVFTLLLVLGRRFGAGRRGLLGKASTAREGMSQAEVDEGQRTQAP